MFKSIRWKFILVYFLLVFIAMLIVGVFIVEKFEEQQLDYRSNMMIKQIESIISTSSYLSQSNWEDYHIEIQNTINNWRLDVSETIYVISGDDLPKIIASSYIDYQVLNGTNALVHKFIDPSLVFDSYKGKKRIELSDNLNEDAKIMNISYPVVNEFGKIDGVLYMTSDLSDIYKTLDSSKNILVKATILALFITVILGFLVANSITEPIRDVTIKTEKMAKGDFEQFVEVKSDDEIGQLANMFNYLTLKLKETIQEIDLERSKLDTIFKYMADGVVAIDNTNTIIHANPIALKLLGKDDKILNNSYKNVLPKEILNLENIDNEGVSLLDNDRVININSNIYRINYAPFKEEKGNIGGVILVFQDITEQYKLNNMRKEFVANVSHELKTPITTIKSYTETLLNFKDIDSSQSENFLEVIDTECDRMNRIVQDLLKLSNMDYRKVNWEKREHKVNPIIEDVVKKLCFQAKSKNQEIILDLVDQLPLAYIDRDGIEQVVSNIVLNSIKYTDNNGKIKIKTRFKNKNIVISVIDNGYGIPKEDRDRIFERFYRVDKGRSRELGGTGLGLSIAEKIMEEHGGYLKLFSKHMLGTKVDIVLPSKDVTGM